MSGRSFLHAEHGVVCEDPQVAGEGRLKSSTDRMPADRRDGHDVRPAQPQESRLAAREPVPEAGTERIGQAFLVRHAFRGEKAQVNPC